MHDGLIWTAWVKSQGSNPNGECLEWRWLKSSYSNGGDMCVEARQRGTVQVRDSKLGDASPVVEYTPAAWRAFITRLAQG